MNVCDGCAHIHGQNVSVQGTTSLKLIGVAECNGILALEHYRCDKCHAIVTRRFLGDCEDRIWRVIEAAH